MTTSFHSLMIVLLSSFLLNCSKLSVMPGGGSSVQSSELNLPELDQNGHFVLSGLKLNAPKELYLLKLSELTGEFAELDLDARAHPPVVSAGLVLKSADALAGAEKIADLDSDTSFTMDSVADAKTYYVFFLKAKTKAPKVIVSKVDFPSVSSVVSKISDGKLLLHWDAVPGALTYDVSSTESVSEADLIVDPFDDAIDYDYCIRPRRGDLQAESCKAFKLAATTTRVRVTKVSSGAADAFYKAGDTIPLQVTFSDVVTVQADSKPTLTLKSGSGLRFASYVSGSGSNTLTFDYLPEIGADTDDLEAQSLSSLDGLVSIVDAKGLAVSLTLPKGGSGNSLADLKNIRIDTLPPSEAAAVSMTAETLTTTTFPVSWTPASDANMKGYRLRLCSVNDCKSSCGSIVESSTSPAQVTGSNNTSYFACVQAEDAAGNLSAWASSAQASYIDTAAASISGVSSPTANGAYKAADLLTISVQFSEAVTVTNGLDLSLALQTGGSGLARYLSGSGSAQLLFQYTVQAGDSSEDLNYQSSAAFQKGSSGAVKNAQGRSVSLTLPALTSGQSLAGQKALQLDTTLPTNPSSVGFASAHNNSGNIAVSWTNSSDSHFQTHDLMLCTQNDCATGCGAPVSNSASPRTIGGGTNGNSYYACVRGRDSAGNVSPYVVSTQTVAVDTTLPTVTNVKSTTADGAYAIGSVLDFSVTFSEAVEVVNGAALALKLETGATDHDATYLSGSGSPTLLFRYTVQAGDTSSLLEAFSTAALSAGVGAIRDLAGNNANLGLPALAGAQSISGQSSIVLDTSNPTPPSALSFASAYAQAGNIQLQWTNGTDTHRKEHEVKLCTQNNCNTVCTGAVTQALSPAQVSGLNGTTYYGCVRTLDHAGNASAWVASAATVNFDSTPATITSMSATTANGSYNAPDTIDITLNISENVIVTNSGDLRLNLETGATDHDAIYASGSGSNQLTFRYTVQAGDTTNDLEAASINALSLGANGLIRDAAGNDATLTLPTAGAGTSLSGGKDIVLDNTAPTDPSAVSFAVATSVSGNLSVNYTAGSDSHLLHHVMKLCPATDCSTSCVGQVNSTSNPQVLSGVNGSTYFACVRAQDQAGNLSNWVYSGGTARVDSSSPTVSSVSSNDSNSYYGLGESFLVDVTFSEAVTVSNTANIQLRMETGASDTAAIYEGGNGTTKLSFRYTVVAGDNNADMEVSGGTALQLTGGATLRDAAGNDATLTLPTSGGSSLSGTKNMIVDTTSPTPAAAPSFASSLTNGATLSVNWTNGTDAHLGSPNVKLCESSDCATNCLASAAAGASPVAVTALANRNYYACVQATDLGGNVSNWTASAGTARIDQIAPTVVSVSASTANGTYKASETIQVTVTFSEAVNLSSPGTTNLQLETGVTDRNASYTSGDGTTALTLTYSVVGGDVSADLDALATTSLTSSGTVRDAAGNDADLTLPALAAGFSLAGQKNIIIDTTAPSAPASVAFQSVSSNNVTISWTNSSDTNFKRHNLKLCTQNDCSTGCVADDTASASPKTLTGSFGSTYYACVQGEDNAGATSAFVASASSQTLDNLAPTITGISSTTPNGAKTEGSTISILVTFSETVVVNNASDLTLALNTGRNALYAAGSGNSALAFTYVVQAGDTTADLDLASINALNLGAAGTIKDATGNAAVISVPAPGAAGSLGQNAALVIDTTAPTNPSSIGFSVAAQATASVAVAWAAASDTNLGNYRLKLCTASDCSSNCTSESSVSGLSSNINGTMNNVYYACVKASDAASNYSDWVSSSTTIHLDSAGPSVTKLTGDAAQYGIYLPLNTVVSFDINFSENVFVTTPAQLALALNFGGRSASYLSGSGSKVLRFVYTIQSGDDRLFPDPAAAGSLTVGSGSIKDALNNDAVLTLPVHPSTDSFAIMQPIGVDGDLPTVPGAVTFPSSQGTATDFGFSWVAATDNVGLKYYNTKICSAADCSTGCGSSHRVSYLSTSDMASGTVGNSYWACVQTEDYAGNLSAYRASTASYTVVSPASFAGVSSGEVLGSFDDGKAKVELTFHSAATGTFNKYRVYFSTSATFASFDLNTPIATINKGDTVYDSNASDTKILVPIPVSSLWDGYYLVRFVDDSSSSIDSNQIVSSQVLVLKGHPNYQLIPRAFSSLSYDYWIMRYEARLSSSGSHPGADAVTEDETNLAVCNYKFHQNGTAADASCGTKNITKYAESLPGVTPTGSISWNAAFFACRNATDSNASVRLPTMEEWKRATELGSNNYFGYLQHNSGLCNTSGSVVSNTGGYADCKTNLNIYDHAGNLSEWVDERSKAYNITTAGETRFGSGPTIGKTIRNGIDNTTRRTHRFTPGETTALSMGAYADSQPGNNHRGTAQLSYFNVSNAGLWGVGMRCIGFRNGAAPSQNQLALPDDPTYAVSDGNNIPENLYIGDKKVETVAITVNGNTGDSVAEGQIAISWSPWKKTVCNSAGSCSSSDFGISYKLYRFLAPDRHVDFGVYRWSFNGNYGTTMPLDPLFVSDMSRLYSTSTTNGKLIATIGNCDSGNSSACTFTDSTSAGTGFSTTRLYDYVLVAEDHNGSAVNPWVQRYRTPFWSGGWGVGNGHKSRWEIRYRRAGVFPVDEYYQQAQAVPQIMIHVPMNLSGYDHDFFMQKYEGSSASGTVSNNSPAGSHRWPIIDSTNWNHGHCFYQFDYNATFDEARCGSGGLLNSTSTVIQSKRGVAPLTGIDRGAYVKACANSSLSDGSGSTYYMHLPTSAEWFKAADWGDLNQDGTIDSNSYTNGITSKTALEDGPGPDGSTVRCHTDNNPASAYNSAATETAYCRSRYNAADMIGNLWEWTAETMNNNTGFDNGLDGLWYGVGLHSVQGNITKVDLLTGAPLAAGPTVNVSGDYIWTSTGERSSLRGGDWTMFGSAGRFSVYHANDTSVAQTNIGGRCAFGD